MLIAALTLALHTAPSTAYRAEFLQAAPGRLLELIDFVKAEQAAAQAAGEARPFLMRHSQGDRWDLLVLRPLGATAAEWLGPAGAARREKARLTGVEHEVRFRALVTWHEELYVTGPALDEVARQFENAGLAHVEAFLAAPGSYDKLLEQRRMEAAFSATLNRPALMIFERDPALGGASWDLFTIDLYRDLKHYADASTIPQEPGDAAAKKAGFANLADIGPTLRRFIASHHDTLAGVLR